ncbi:MAG: hypothetical protein GY809_12190, partial [Planctomycetes bacterium]|nr:hypothetical protein [Planctomycetota bacterium]
MNKVTRLLISFHINDGKWKEAFVRNCKPYEKEGELRVKYDEVNSGVEHPHLLDDETAESFDAVLILISKDYLSSSMLDDGIMTQL